MERFDVTVVGGGLLGCFVARELCRWKLSVLLLEAREDVCTGVSRANTAVVYPGYDHKPGTLKAEMTVRANTGFDALCRELDVPFSRCGSLMLSYGQRADAVLQKKYRQGLENDVPGLRLLDDIATYRMEPSLAPGLHLALYAPTAGTVNPWQLGIAACENAVQNGVQLRLNAPLRNIYSEKDGYLLETAQGIFHSRSVVNCAGLNAVHVQEMLFSSPIHIVPTAGDYYVLDRSISVKPTHILQYETEEKGKGLTVVPTAEGSLLLGPSERDCDSEDFSTDQAGLKSVAALSAELLPSLDLSGVIRSFAAVRPNPQRSDGSSIHSFTIEHPACGFWSLIGIKTPGMTCAQQLGLYLARQLSEELDAEPNPAFHPLRPGICKVRDLSDSRRKALAKQDADYGEMICFCEEVTRAEVLEAIARGAVTVDGVKRRTGSGMGRCQGARCQQKITEILAEALKIPENAVTKDGRGSEFLRDRYDAL